MVLDARIAMGIQPLDIGASIGRGYQLRDLVAQSEARTLDAKLKQQAVQKQTTLGNFHKMHTTGGKLDRAAFAQSMTDAGYGADMPGIQKQWTDQDKSEIEYLTKNREGIIKTLDYSNKAFGALAANPNATADDVIREISAMTQFGIMTPEQGAQAARSVPADPGQLRQFLQQKLLQSQQAKDMYAAAMPQLQAINLGGSMQVTDMNPLTNPGVVGQTFQRTATPGEIEAARHNRASEGLIARGQNLVDARSREANQNHLSRPFEVTGPDGKPLLVQQDKSGNIHPVQGYSPKDADKALTEGQSKSVLFGARMESANQTIDELAQKGVNASTPGSRSGFGVGAVVTALSGADKQRLDQAKRDFINAVLRRESGAAIAVSEFDNAELQYFPQVGDSAQVIAQKKKNRDIATRGMQAEIPDNKRHLVDQVLRGNAAAGGQAKVVNFSDLK